MDYLKHLCRSMLGLDRPRFSFCLHWCLVVLLGGIVWAQGLAARVQVLDARFHGDGDLRWGFPFLILSLLWGMDTAMNTARAWKEHRFAPEVFNRSFSRIMFWISVCIACGLLRWAGPHYALLGFDYMEGLASTLEVMAILSEFASVLRTLGDWNPTRFPGFSGLLYRYADKTESTAVQLASLREEVKQVNEKVSQPQQMAITQEVLLEVKPVENPGERREAGE